MKKLRFIMCLMILAAISSFVKASESIIDENKIWTYIYATSQNVITWHWRFNGVTVINGKEYHKLYFKKTIYEDVPHNYSENLNQINSIPEFEFDNLSAQFLMRKEGKKYYMLFAKEMFNKDGEIINAWEPGSFYNYGSNLMETLIYDFSLDAGDYFYRCPYPGMPEDNIFEFPEKGYFDLNSLYGYPAKITNRVDVVQKKEWQRWGRNYNVIEYDCDSSKFYHKWLAVESIGDLDFCLANPGYFNDVFVESYFERQLANVRRLDGEYIYGEYFIPKYVKPAVVDDVETEKAEAEYFGIDGRKVDGSPAPGIYIERKGNSVRKVIIK